MSSAYKIKSVSDFITHVIKWRMDDLVPTVFRGQRYSEWKAAPKLFRKDVGLSKYEKFAVRDLISVHPQEFQFDQTMFDRLVRMQHYGLPTRLLDVTTNPLVALYFACEDHHEKGEPQDGKVQAFFTSRDNERYFDSDQVSCLANLANLTGEEKDELFSAAENMSLEEFNLAPITSRLLWFVQNEKPHFIPKIDPNHLLQNVLVKPKMSNRRIIAQSGAFIIFGAPLKDESRTNIKIKRINVPADRKPKIRGELELLGVHASTIFPELDKAATYITERYARLAP